MDEYIRAASKPAAIHVSCEDFRAAADIDLEMDRANDAAGQKIQCPLHALWGAKGTVGPLWDILATWSEVQRIGNGKGSRLRSFSARRKSS